MAFDNIAPPAFNASAYADKQATNMAYEIKTWNGVELSHKEIVNIANEIYRNINVAMVRAGKS